MSYFQREHEIWPSISQRERMWDLISYLPDRENEIWPSMVHRENENWSSISQREKVRFDILPARERYWDLIFYFLEKEKVRYDILLLKRRKRQGNIMRVDLLLPKGYWDLISLWTFSPLTPFPCVLCTTFTFYMVNSLQISSIAFGCETSGSSLNNVSNFSSVCLYSWSRYQVLTNENSKKLGIVICSQPAHNT